LEADQFLVRNPPLALAAPATNLVRLGLTQTAPPPHCPLGPLAWQPFGDLLCRVALPHYRQSLPALDSVEPCEDLHQYLSYQRVPGIVLWARRTLNGLVEHERCSIITSDLHGPHTGCQVSKNHAAIRKTIASRRPEPNKP